jgi:serine/threonine protein kinase
MMDDYHVAEQIGEGSFGKVYKGRRRYTSQVTINQLSHTALSPPSPFCLSPNSISQAVKGGHLSHCRTHTGYESGPLVIPC